MLCTASFLRHMPKKYNDNWILHYDLQRLTTIKLPKAQMQNPNYIGNAWLCWAAHDNTRQHNKRQQKIRRTSSFRHADILGEAILIDAGNGAVNTTRQPPPLDFFCVLTAQMPFPHMCSIITYRKVVLPVISKRN